MADAEPVRDRVRNLAFGLNGDHGVLDVGTRIGEVLEQLVERLGARTAGVAVLEQEQRPSIGVREHAIEVGDGLELEEPRVELAHADCAAL
jgi:hypothetical protein